MPIPAEDRASGMRPCWTGYVGVGDVDASATHVAAAGGVIHRAPDDIPGVGRFAVAADPQGAGFMPFTPNREALAAQCLDPHGALFALLAPAA